MQRDMELVRKILFKIEEIVDNVACYDLEVEGYSMEQIAYHCAILYEGGYIYDYKAEYAGNSIYAFGVGRLTWDGHDFLDKIREDTIWKKTKDIIKDKGLPLVFDIVKSVSTEVVSGLVNSYVGV